MVELSNSFRFTCPRYEQSYNPDVAVTTSVWAVPRSLAATGGITFVFSSSVYLDVSVRQVILLSDVIQNMTGCPIRISVDRFICADTHSFSQLITSFIFVKSLGILHTPFRNLSIL